MQHSAPHNTEPIVNHSFGELLGYRLARSTVRSENTQSIVGHRGLQPDVLVTASGRAPVSIEAEYLPASNVEKEAKDRLGLQVVEDRRYIESAIALRYPLNISTAVDVSEAIVNTQFTYCAFTKEQVRVRRFPENGWLSGSVTDVADMVRLVSVSESAVDRAADTLQSGIEEAAKLLDDLSSRLPGITESIARLLGMANVPQTRRMACAILANAMVFHEQFAGIHATVKPLGLVCNPSSPNPQESVLAAWEKILQIDYWPIFGIAKDLLQQFPSRDAALLLQGLRGTAQTVNALGVENAHDLTGRIFQRLIADRKYLATFYTTPASAALLARLSVSKIRDLDWSGQSGVSNLRIADFACGTGALLSAVYEQVSARYERVGNDPTNLHKTMMEDVIYGCDVMPSAVHITGSTLSGIYPRLSFGKTHLYSLAYGRQNDESVKIGSLELLQRSSALSLFNTSDPGKRTGSAGEETATQIIAEFPDSGFDLVIMNPPFTRAGSDWEGADRSEDYVKQFRGLATDLSTQKEMSSRLKAFASGSCYHGYAGIASAFAALANRKLKPGGVIALVLPLSAASGQSWRKFRQMMVEEFSELMVLSIASADPNGLAFSADTGMAECLVVARKLERSERSNGSIRFVSLPRRPSDFAHASTLAQCIRRLTDVRRLSDGPFGGTPLAIGDQLEGEVVDATCEKDGAVWSATRLADFSLAQIAEGMVRGQLALPGSTKSHKIQIARLNDVGERGMHDMNIAGNSASAPFSRFEFNPTATYPALWKHSAKKETQFVCTPDTALRVKPGKEKQAGEVWRTAGRAHLSKSFRFNSQPLAASFTSKRSIGGAAWPNVNFAKTRHDFAFVVWSNSTLGLLLYWWHANRQQSGRGIVTVSAADELPILNLCKLDEDQLLMAELIFDEFQHRDFLPAYLADVDPSRVHLDRRVICDLLGLDEAVYLGVREVCAKWCAEPTVHGGKARPPEYQQKP